MRLEQLKRAHDSRPFRAFGIRMTSGQTFDVPSPEHLYIPPNTQVLVVAAESGTVALLDPGHVVRLIVEAEPTTSPAPAKSVVGSSMT